VAGETIKAEAICLSIRPWSKTSHVVAWLTPNGKVSTVVKGAVRPKSFLLGQYDLNYTCEIVYYARERGELHALRECSPLNRRDFLREDYRLATLAGYFRKLAFDFAPQGIESAAWYDMLSAALDAGGSSVSDMVRFEIDALGLLGLEPGLEAEGGGFSLRGERRIPVSPEVAEFIKNPTSEVKNSQIPLDAARVIGVFYQFHLGCSAEIRRNVLSVISK